MRKLCCEIIGIQGDNNSVIEMVDPYHDYNRPFEYTVFADSFEFKVNLLQRLLIFISPALFFYLFFIAP